ncbi:MAG: hypothetical protein WC732_08415 [Candidatus Omnitrophota bacterium]
MIDISGIDKVTLLEALWHRSSTPASVMACGVVGDFDRNLARRAVLGPIDYFGLHPIKADISGVRADPRGFDDETHHGAFARVVAVLRGAPPLPDSQLHCPRSKTSYFVPNRVMACPGRPETMGCEHCPFMLASHK